MKGGPWTGPEQTGPDRTAPDRSSDIDPQWTFTLKPPFGQEPDPPRG